jgi:4-hydroxy-2-oxoheptanedioate aldolase
VPLVRVPKNDHELILGYLETGALGIVVPHIRTADDAVRAVRAVKYHPLGDRSSGAFSRAANYGVTQTAAEYLSRANDETMVVLLVEDVEGFENLEGIIAVEGIDAVMLGQSDLAMSMGLPGQGDHPSVRSLVGAARDMLRGSAVALSATVRTADEARRAVADGATFIDLNLYAAWDSPLREFAGLSRNEEL